MKLSLEIDDMVDDFDMPIDDYINMYLSNINDVIKIRTSDFMKSYLNEETVTLSNYAKFIYDILKTGETCWINTLDEASIIRMETRQLEIKRIEGKRERILHLKSHQTFCLLSHLLQKSIIFYQMVLWFRY